jgi:hypothetical protein
MYIATVVSCSTAQTLHKKLQDKVNVLTVLYLIRLGWARGAESVTLFFAHSREGPGPPVVQRNVASFAIDHPFQGHIPLLLLSPPAPRCLMIHGAILPHCRAAAHCCPLGSPSLALARSATPLHYRQVPHTAAHIHCRTAVCTAAHCHTAVHCCTAAHCWTAGQPHNAKRTTGDCQTTAAHCLAHCRTGALPHTSALPHTALLPHTATLPDYRTLPNAQPHIL